MLPTIRIHQFTEGETNFTMCYKTQAKTPEKTVQSMSILKDCMAEKANPHGTEFLVSWFEIHPVGGWGAQISIALQKDK